MKILSRLFVLPTLASLLFLTGCGTFFLSNSSSSSSSSSSTGDYVYVVNQTTDTLSGYVVGSGALTAISGSPYSLVSGLTPQSVTITRPNTFVYVGGTGAISCYSIGTGGVLTLVNATAASASARFVSLDTSPDGQWLLALDSATDTIYTFQINTSTGALTAVQNLAYSIAANAGTVIPSKIRISPNGAYVVAALGTGGDAIFTFNTSTGVLTQAATLYTNSTYSDNAVTFDANSAYVYIARGSTTSGSAGVSSYSIASTGALTSVQALAPSGNAPYAVLLDLTGDYLYTANRADGTLSGYSASAGMLTALSPATFKAGTTATALARDNSGKYLIAASFGGSSDLTLYSFDALNAGQLDAVATYTSGTDPAGSIALACTHTSAGL